MYNIQRKMLYSLQQIARDIYRMYCISITNLELSNKSNSDNHRNTKIFSFSYAEKVGNLFFLC